MSTRPVRPPSVGPLVAALAVAWTLTLAASLAWNLHSNRETVQALVLASARASLQKDLLYRGWAARHGGVYVPITAETPPNPFLTLPERDVVTTTGLRLTLVNPAYMVRQAHEMSPPDGIQGHLTSLRPLRPGNAPDPWEREALARFEQGEREAFTIFGEGSDARVRFMRPLLVESPCLRCHEQQGYRIGDVRGGISATLPIASAAAATPGPSRTLLLAHGGIWLLGAIGIAAWARRHGQRVRESERHEEERRSLERQLHHARRIDALGRLTGGIAHDLNNLLAPILGFSSALVEDLPPGSPQRDDAAEIRQAAQRARDLTRRLLTFSRQQDLKSELLDAGEAVLSMAKMLSAILGEDCQLIVDVPPAPRPRIRADQAQLELALINLAGNARDAMASGGTLRISLREETRPPGFAGPPEDAGRVLVLTVSDTGTGMDDETLAHLFEPFFTTKAPGKGTGLGLATAHAAVKAQGGTIEVESAPGRGTTFRVVFPIVAGARETIAASARPPTGAPRGTETVLVVEDEVAVRGMVSKVLDGLGYRVRSAATPAEALAMAGPAHLAPALLLTDVIMPGMGGDELAARLRESHPGLRVLFMSGNPRDRLGPIAGGALPLLWKPFSSEELALAVRGALECG